MTPRRSRVRGPLVWAVWHPHQKLWNWRLESALRRVGRAVGAPTALVSALVFVDSALLYASVIGRRARAFGLRDAFRLAPVTTRPVLYVDCGVHKHGEQLRCMHDWFANRCDLHMLGFEASAEHHREACANLGDLDHLDLRQVALVGPDTREGYVRLYKGPRDGKADSLHTPGERFEDVPAEPLSRVLQRDYASYLADAPVLVRMNIEGSEYDVIADLVRSGLAARVDGYFGMWDDVAKIDPARDRDFRKMLRAARIRTVTFNDRDLTHPLRRRAITLAVDAAMRYGFGRRPGAGGGASPSGAAPA